MCWGYNFFSQLATEQQRIAQLRSVSPGSLALVRLRLVEPYLCPDDERRREMLGEGFYGALGNGRFRHTVNAGDVLKPAGSYCSFSRRLFHMRTDN